MEADQPAFVLTFSCVDAVGIVAAVTGLLAERDGFILDSQQYADLDSGRFFMRVEFREQPRHRRDDADRIDTAERQDKGRLVHFHHASRCVAHSLLPAGSRR